MEGPEQFAGANVEAAGIAGRAEAGRVLRMRTGDDYVLVDDGRAGKPVVRVWVFRLILHAGLEIELAVIPEARNGHAGFDVDGDEETVTGAEEDTSGIVLVARPVRDAARGTARVAVFEGPDDFAGFGFERHERLVRRCDIHHAVDDERRCLALPSPATGSGRGGGGGGPAIEGPGLGQLRGIGGVDLREGGVAGTARVAAVGLPVRLGIEGRDDQGGQQERFDCGHRSHLAYLKTPTASAPVICAKWQVVARDGSLSTI